MAILEEKRLENVRAVLGLCRAGEGTLERFDAAVAKLDAREAQAALREAGRQLRQLGERVTVLEEIAEALGELERASAWRAVVLDAAGDGPRPTALVSLLGQQTQIVVGTLPGAEIAALEHGDEVELVRVAPDQYAIRRRVGRHDRHGSVSRIVELAGPGLLRVSRGPEELFLRATAPLRREIEAFEDPGDVLGRLVSFDEGLGLAFGLRGAPAREELVLREFPRVRREELVVAPGLARRFEEEILFPAAHAELASRYGITPARSFIFEGPPGVGKTHAARWIASELGRPVYLIDGAELASMWYGQTEAQLRSRLEAAASERAGAVVVWDEAEALLGERGHSALGVEHRVVTQMLAALDGFLQRGERVLVILTTNRADQMDVALKRHLRAQTVAFGRPDAPRTRALFELYLRELPLADGDARSLAREAALAIFGEPEPLAEAVLRDGTRLPIARSAGVSGALARAACERARRIAFARHVKLGANGAPAAVVREDLHAALDEQLAALAGSLTAENLARMVSLPARAAGAVAALELRSGSERRRFVGEPRADVPPRASAADGRSSHAA
jgi:hypothetical protein